MPVCGDADVTERGGDGASRGNDAEAVRLVAEAGEVGVNLEAGHVLALRKLAQLVMGAEINVSGLHNEADVRRKHLVDSLSCLALARLSPGDRVLDLGSGAGFPGVPVALVRPDVSMILVEPRARKAAFLRTMLAGLGREDIEVIQARAEDLGRRSEWRDSADCVLARAVAPLRVLIELAVPLCRVGGRLVALKGPAAFLETQESGAALRELGAALRRTHALTLPGGADRRVLLEIEKLVPTPGRYPRRAGLPQLRPL